MWCSVGLGIYSMSPFPPPFDATRQLQLLNVKKQRLFFSFINDTSFDVGGQVYFGQAEQ